MAYDHLSSNPVVKRYDCEPYYDGHTMEEHVDGEWVSFEDFERLTAELDRILTREDDTIKEMLAERDRLAAELQMTRNEADTADRNRASAIAENDRLRAALERIANDTRLCGRCVDMAREALEGHVHSNKCWEPDSGCDMGRSEEHAVRAPDEPSVVQIGCFCHDVELGNAKSCPIHGPAENGEGSRHG